MIQIEKIEQSVREKESKERFAHTQNVRQLALEMAVIYGTDTEKTDIAALFHDFCKDSNAPGNALAHGKQAADILKDEFDVQDADILNAVTYHTTGRAGMSDLEMILFVADTVEPGRTYEGADRLRKLALQNLEEAALTVLVELKAYLIRNGLEPSKNSEEAIQWLRKR